MRLHGKNGLEIASTHKQGGGGHFPLLNVQLCISHHPKLFKEKHFIPQSGFIIFVPALEKSNFRYYDFRNY